MMSDGGWLGIVAIAVSGVLALLNKWEANRHDGKIKDLETQNDWQGRELGRHSVELDKCKEEHACTKEELERTRVALAERTAAERQFMQSQIEDLKEQVSVSGLKERLKEVGVKTDTATHAPLTSPDDLRQHKSPPKE
jgi:hypothetical protein